MLKSLVVLNHPVRMGIQNKFFLQQISKTSIPVLPSFKQYRRSFTTSRFNQHATPVDDKKDSQLGHGGHSHSHGPGGNCDGSHSHGASDAANELEDHDHIHLRESETETNDSFTFGSINHSHNHSHGQNELLVWDKKKFWENPGVRITWIGLLINVGMATGKLVGGIVFHSQALMADSVHAISDLVSDFLTLGTVGLAARGPNQNFPYGYGKIETVGSLAVSSILTMAGLSIGWASLVNIVGPMVPHTIIEALNAYHIHLLSGGHGHSHAHAHDITNVNAAWIAGASIVAKEWIFKATSKIAKEQNSKVLLANAWHHRVDSLTSLVALITITGGHFFGIQSLDAVGGLLVSGLVIKAGFNGIVIATNELIDRSVPKTDARYIEIDSKLNDLLGKLLSNNNSKKPYSINELVLLTSGPNVHAKVKLEVPLQRWDNVLDINEFEIVSHHLKTQLIKDIDNLRNVDIEFIGEKPEPEEESKEESTQESAQEPEHSHSHDSNHSHKH
ncbi:Mitochondrial metal transporter 1 [Wickerhamomyces ciferrii]|uniref:Mitochondrial metal transporter 1 n=1 Tax=Wickerhamomyces ciferrii (strain ATCC 14091 / BCRC 22168 / CBS 111 / JCM 3599 / NBRC 0793 / NRRL Y-1031 F-60-10) TaxID=1206466 RepID=K0KUZ3_WICCF|nr:Mitochondrial metal transporter 1 [Wickerhamomyces ciferrii]CCH44978.1 Mitochondrial metal transporter 1 [Wickerhamomyces ciferrii]